MWHQNKLSAASQRALRWPEVGNEWFGEFQVFGTNAEQHIAVGVFAVNALG